MRELWKRLGLAWHVLRGKPLMYGATFEGEVTLPHPENVGLLVTCCEFRGVLELSLWAIVKGRIRDRIEGWKGCRQAKKFHRRRRKHIGKAVDG